MATADATSFGGVLRVPIACSNVGAVGNADDGTALILVTPVNGLPSSGVADTLIGGFDTEDLETWRARVIERYYWTPQGGADGDYVVWAKEVPGITRAWTYRHWMGTGTVGVMIASSDLINPIPEESTETAVRQHIEPLAPVAGSDLYVFRPVAHTVDFHIRVTPDTPEIRAAITAELRSFLLRDGYPQGELKVSRISEAISGANGNTAISCLHRLTISPLRKMNWRYWEDFMDVTNDDYILLLSALLPPGPAWVGQRSGDCRCGTVINPCSSACGCPDAGAGSAHHHRTDKPLGAPVRSAG
ncbi:Uncharacterized homolog of phage Mu protein gp47 [Edwardsiella hoshinae]|uniref:Uncharacterized homolog of phage Mu protein gp47 n=1 Tax=Edwardsiella hoshinae TaxID=93378 RepID=A0A376J225_9GAMM|nr:Uncharacterized homolog of phage Mu protein gp47 [Edwardsiella hoshinae]